LITVDSCGWLEFYTNGPLCNQYAEYLRDLNDIITPVIILYEIYKKVKREYSEDEALLAIIPILKTKVILLDNHLALMAADISLESHLPMADAIVFATAQFHGSQLITSDIHFKNLKNVIYLGS